MTERLAMKTLTALLSTFLLLTATAAIAADFQPVTCEGTYPHHLQGVCTDEKDAIFWCFTTKMVKTDRTGKITKQVDVANHHGDLCFHQGKVYVALNLGKFNDPKGNADSWVYVYNAGDLSLLAKHRNNRLRTLDGSYPSISIDCSGAPSRWNFVVSC